MEVFVTHGLDRNSALMQRLIEAGAEEVHRRMNSIRDDVKAEIEGLIAEKLHPRTEGPPDFRHKEGQEHLAGSIQVEVDWDGRTFPIQINVGSTADPHEVGALEFGSTQSPHPIDAKHKPFLIFPSNQISRGSGQTRGVFGRAFNATGQGGNFASFGVKGGVGSRGGTSRRLVKTKHVDHPGNPAFHFMRTGLDRVVRRVLGGG